AARRAARGCPDRGLEGHDPDALHCRKSGGTLPDAFSH
ncbi:ion transporter, partial [Stenotrophomonas maltophilia]